jgi:polyhydroxyalkanoate synthesis regulator phasin
MSQPIDVERELAELRAQVRRTPAPPSDQELTALQKAIANLNANWYIAATLPPPAPNAPFTWRVVYVVKRIMRRAMVELLNTVVQQQNAFNHQVARALTELASQETRLEALEQRLAQLEKGDNATES